MKLSHFILLLVLLLIIVFSCTSAPQYTPTKESSTDYDIIYEDEE